MAQFVYFRYVLVMIAFYGMAVVNMTRSDFNVTILKMIDNDPNCVKSRNNSHFCWSQKIEEMLVAGYFIGYLFQIPGGYVASRFGAYHIVGLSMVLTVGLSFVTPAAAARDWRVLLIVRVLQGLGASVTYPAMTAMWSKWAPQYEKSTLFSIMSCGHFAGAAIADALSGILCDQVKVFGGSWQSVFILFGIVGVVWLILWYTFASSEPDHSFWVSLDELDYIKLHRMAPCLSQGTPWKWIFTSARCWAIYLAHFCSYCGYLNMLVCYPQYFKDVRKMDIKKLGIVSAIPVISMFLMSIVSGRVTDMILSRDLASTTIVRKVNTAIGLLIPSALNFVIAYAPDLSSTAVIAIMTVQSSANAFVLSGFQVNYIDISPDHAGITMGVGNTLATIAGIAVPLILYRFKEKSGADVEGEWRSMFVSVGAIMAAGALIYIILGTGKRQLEGMNGYEEPDSERTDSCAEETTKHRSSYRASSSSYRTISGSSQHQQGRSVRASCSSGPHHVHCVEEEDIDDMIDSQRLPLLSDS